MNRILITGATGNTGFEVIRYLFKNGTRSQIVAGVRNIENAKKKFIDFPKLELVNFDFEDQDTFDQSLNQIDIVFLLRPPHISDTEKYFRPLIEKIKQKGIKKVLFLSVQGAEKSKIIPHNRIENLIKEYKLEHIFLRPSYFMQNLTTTLISDINNLRKIILPAGKAKFNWIDVGNIGEASAMLIEQFENYINLALEITGTENLNFKDVVNLINTEIQDSIEYSNVNPFKFYNIKKKENLPKGMIMVMIMLHFLPRLQKEPRISDFYEKLTGKKPTLLKEFISRERSQFIVPDF